MEWSVRDREILDTVGPADRPVAARLLARIRAVEAACVAEEGNFDWELLDEATQDEYDLLRSDLSKLRYPDEAPRSAEEVHQRDYRVIYEVDEVAQTVLVTDIGRRDSIY